jgi:hypothetical protein
VPEIVNYTRATAAECAVVYEVAETSARMITEDIANGVSAPALLDVKNAIGVAT